MKLIAFLFIVECLFFGNIISETNADIEKPGSHTKIVNNNQKLDITIPNNYSGDITHNRSKVVNLSSEKLQMNDTVSLPGKIKVKILEKLPFFKFNDMH